MKLPQVDLPDSLGATDEVQATVQVQLMLLQASEGGIEMEKFQDLLLLFGVYNNNTDYSMGGEKCHPKGH